MIKYILTEQQLKSLLESKIKLEILEAAGVDNWMSYSEASQDLDGYEESFEEGLQNDVESYLKKYETTI
jgi:hypothetical protein